MDPDERRGPRGGGEGPGLAADPEADLSLTIGTNVVQHLETRIKIGTIRASQRAAQVPEVAPGVKNDDHPKVRLRRRRNM